MGRWRPRPTASTPYITPEGYQRMEEELKALWDRRRDVARALAAAAAEGDRSENAEYIYRKKELRGIDSRIGYLQRRMPKLTIVNQVGDPGSIFFGAWVTLETEQGKQIKYRIVGPDEIDARENYISIDSPMAKALRGKAVNDEINLKIESHTFEYLITGIHYSDSMES